MERSGPCGQQPSPNARETRPPDPNHEAGNKRRVFRFLRSVFERWARVGDRPLSRGLHHGVARLPRWPTGWAESLSRISLLDLSPSRVPGEDRVGPAGAVTTQCLKRRGRPAGSVPTRCELRPAGDDSAHAECYRALGELRPCQKTHPVLPRPAQSDWPSFGSSFLCPRSCGTSGIPLRPAHSRSLLLCFSWLRCLRGSCIGHGALGWLLFYCQCSPLE